MQKSLRKNPYLLLAGATLLFYLPVASLRFAIKNDLFTGYFPARFHLTSFLHAGMFPLWDPWINYGLPFYGDITATAWNPLTVFIASTVGYNAYTMTMEVLLAIFIAGVAMHTLCTRMGFEARASLVTALCYMASGYFIGDLQHLNWVWGAALLPWCATGFLRFTGSGQWRDLPSSVLPFLLFLTAAHPGLMIGAAYLFLLWMVALCLGIGPEEQRTPGWQPFQRALVLFLAVVVVSLGLMYGYGYNLLLTTRAPGEASIGSAHGASTASTWISALLPFSTTSTHDRRFDTDIALRNIYIGLLPLVMVLHAWLFQRNRWTIFWSIVIIFFLFISGGPGINGGLSAYLPLLSQVRLEGEFRIFAMFGGLILSASVLHRPFRDIGGRSDRIAIIFQTLTILFISTAVMVLAAMLLSRESIPNHGQVAPGIKGFLHSLDIVDAILVQSMIQAFICFGLWRCFRQASLPVGRIILLVVLDMTLSAGLNLPYTGVGSRSVSDLQTLIDRSPKDVPALDMRSTTEITAEYPNTDSVIGYWGLYAKQIANSRRAAYPMRLKSGTQFFPVHSDSLLKKGMLFTDGEQEIHYSVKSFQPDKAVFLIRSEVPQTLYWKQMFHPRWTAAIHGAEIEPRPAHGGIIGIQVPSGEQEIVFSFSDPMGRWAQAYHFFAFVMLLVITLYHRVRKR